LAAKTWRKVIVRGVLLILLLLEGPWLLRGFGLIHPRVDDQAGLIPWRQQFQFETYLKRMYDESGVDLRFLLMDQIPSGSLEEFSLRRARALGIGRDLDRRGVLFVYDMQGQRLRVEVGPQLEGIFTDAFVGYLMRNHVRGFFAVGDPELGLRLTLFILHARLRRAALGEDYDPRAATFVEDSKRLAVGGGASSRMPTRGGPAGFLNQKASAQSRLTFGPQPSPQAAYTRYLEWLRSERFEPDVPLFDAPSQGYLATLPMTAAFREYLLFLEYGHAHRIVERGSLALLYFTDDPLICPHFLFRGPDGWQLDMVAELRNTVNYAGGRYTWGYRNTGDQYARAFTDHIVSVGGTLRLKDGDNRPLQTLSGR
jgi:uncharacterized protein